MKGTEAVNSDFLFKPGRAVCKSFHIENFKMNRKVTFNVSVVFVFLVLFCF